MLTAALLDRLEVRRLRCDALGSAFLPKRRAADSLPALAARRNTDAASFKRHRYLGEWASSAPGAAVSDVSAVGSRVEMRRIMCFVAVLDLALSGISCSWSSDGPHQRLAQAAYQGRLRLRRIRSGHQTSMATTSRMTVVGVGVPAGDRLGCR